MIDESLWRELEVPQPERGRSTRRLFPESEHDIHLGVTHPGRQRMLLVRADVRAVDHARQLLASLHPTHGLSLACSPVSNLEFELQISLTASELRAVFTPLAEDIARTAADAADDTVLEAAVRRFVHWQRLMRSVGAEGLGREARLGLYGELHFLREHLLGVLPDSAAVGAWTGPEGTNQDFQMPGAALEVKASAAKNPGTIRISNERQLDSTGTGQLFLTLIALDERRGGSGESLNTAVDDVRSRLDGASAQARLETQLARIGYFAHQRHLYDEPRYTVRRTDLWRVGDGFPRLVEADLPGGIGNCSYEISVSALENHRTTADAVAELIRGIDG
ncbi:PD-(D/E)XK motif protein [Streptomyces chartreusis]|uniref:PD-(D/E)XK motif protein n=1 Tax=Streptomyces chartreusis TaxID=1969 RepID=UPI00369F5C79